jgi:hypothetical protein
MWWKVLWYDHPHPREVLATREQKEAMKVFSDWRKAISLGMLQHDSVTVMLEDVAVKQADREEAAASKATTLKWVSWLHEGPAAGLGRQHRMSKVAQGWAPTATAGGRDSDMPDLEDGTCDGDDGLSQEELLEAIEDRRENDTPASTQQEADGEALDWGNGQWKANTVYIEPDWSQDSAEGLVEMAVEHLKKAAMTMSDEDPMDPRSTEPSRSLLTSCIAKPKGT